MSEVLNLAGANTSGFDAIPSDTYDATVYEIDIVEFEKEDGKLPQGTKGYNVQFRVEGGQYDGRFVWNRYWLVSPDADYDATKKANMDGMFARFLMAIGYSEKEVTSGKFKFDIDDAKGRPCRVNVGQNEYQGEIRNTVRNVKPAGVDAEAAGIL